MSNLFVEITDDLSYARTFYPRRSVRVYLNNLAQSVFNSLYKLKRDPFGNFWKFWKVGLPVEMYHARKNLLASFIVFGIAILIGVVSTVDDPEFTRIILGDNYVNMTDNFIEDGDPMAVYKQESEFPMFVSLFLNNIRVSFFCFALGILFCVGTGFFLFFNGIMLGTFHTYFYFKELALGKGLFLTSLLTVWIHGTFEIFGIILSGAAGFVAGMSLLNPGTYTRAQSFQIGLKRGLKIMMGVTPFIFFAAILEGFVTRHTEMPVAMKLFIILGSLAIILFYFVFYPMYIVKKYPEEAAKNAEPAFTGDRKVELYKLKQVNEIVADSFLIFRKLYSKFAKYLWGILIPLHLIWAWFLFTVNEKEMNYYGLNPFEITDNMIDGQETDILFFMITVALFSFSMALPMMSLKRYEGRFSTLSKTGAIGKYMVMGMIFIPFMFIFFCSSFIQSDALLYFMAVLPLIVYTPVAIIFSQQKGFSKFTHGISTFFNNIGNSFMLFLVSVLVLGGFFVLVNSLVYLIIENLVEWHTITEVNKYSLLINYIHTVIYIVFLQHFFIFLAIIFGLYHFVNIEIQESVSLFEKIKNFGKTSKTHEKFQYNEE